MGVQKKHGKGRLDKWYKLAKEKGYRARAAFKLIQLNRKYGFLERSKVLLDLCAAPGSWCQVAAETMPLNSLIIGVDLATIKPIPRTITFQSDITTDKCRASIKQHLKTWKADVVLHDGAPNVGTAWVQDAFSQAELVLQSLKLAVEFLVEGGTFVTKIFRSKDYNALLWVFNQLFGDVEATKPPSSRNVSAEIFVVCRSFKAPKRIDPRFLDPRTVFAELSDPTPNNEAKVFNPEKKKRKREGYEAGDHTQFHEAPASKFIQTTDPIAILGSHNKLSFEQKQNGDIALATLSKLPETTMEIKLCCDDLKVLGRKEFRMLLRWRLKVREIFGFATKKKVSEAETNEVAEVTQMDEELRIQGELQKLLERESGARKRERRRENERKQKEIVRMQLHMTTPNEIGLEQEGPNGSGSVFGLKAVDQASAVEKIARGKMGVQIHTPDLSDDTDTDEDEDEEADNLDAELDNLYSQYQERKLETDARYRAKKARKEYEDGQWEGLVSDKDVDSNEEFQEEQDSQSSSNEDAMRDGKLIFPRRYPEVGADGLTRRATSFFEQDIFKNVGVIVAGDHDSTVDLDKGETNDTMDTEKDSHQSETAILNPSRMDVEVIGHHHKKEILGDEQENTLELKDQSHTESESAIDDSFEEVKNLKTNWENRGESGRDGRPDIDIITAEAMTLAQQVASGEKTIHSLADDGFNKYTFRDVDGLPEWFLDDESKHSKPLRPISAAGAAAIKEKIRALNARPIKKVREAKERKKFKAAQKLEKLKKKSGLVADDEAISEKDKASNIAKIMAKAAKKKPKQQVKVIVARGGNRGIPGRPKGVKGRYKIVDARLKKDVRADKRLAKEKKKR